MFSTSSVKETRIAIPGEKNYQQPGYFIVDGIITWRCDVCFQHMSLYKYSVDKNGVVTPDIFCENCETTHEGVVLSLFDKKDSKGKDSVKIKGK